MNSGDLIIFITSVDHIRICYAALLPFARAHARPARWRSACLRARLLLGTVRDLAPVIW